MDEIMKLKYYAMIIIALIAAISPLFSLAYKILSEIQKQRYIRYHDLIEKLVSNEKSFIECQSAEVFELRFLRKYRKATSRIFTHLIELWKAKPDQSVINEMKLAIKSLDNKYPIFWRFSK